MAEATIPEDAAAQLERIRTITQTARATWFGYLGAVAFTAVTLMGVEDVDFFALDSATQLPLIGISVPVKFFFGAGALIITVIFAYLHVFLEQLWYALGRAPARVGEEPLATHVHPWLVSSFALYLRRRRNGDDDPAAPCTDSTPLGWVGVVASALLLYGAGPVLLGWLWYRSMPAHDAWMTGGIGILFGITLLAAWESGNALFANLRHGQHPEARTWSLWHGPARRGIAMVLLAGLAVVSAMRTEWDRWGYAEKPVIMQDAGFRTRVQHWFRPVSAQLDEARLVELPKNWRPRYHAVRSFYANWCKRTDTEDCAANIPVGYDSAFQREWQAVRKTFLDTLLKPKLSGKDLSFATLARAHLPGIDMSNGDLRNVQALGAQLEGAKLDGAMLQGAWIPFADLSNANLEGADLSNVFATAVNMQGVQLTNAVMQGAQFTWAQFQRADWGGRLPAGASITFSYLAGFPDKWAVLGPGMDHAVYQTNFRGSAFRYTEFDLTSGFSDEWSKNVSIIAGEMFFEDFILDGLLLSFGDGTVKLPDGFERPCQWSDEVLDDAAFFGHWRGWLAAIGLADQWESTYSRFWEFSNVGEYAKIPAVPPPAECIEMLGFLDPHDEELVPPEEPLAPPAE